MNWYEHHIGDYDKNTSHLTACEDGIYSRMIRRYYDKETPLPADVNEVKRLVRARARDERAAVDAVLREFFTLEEDGWHHKTIDEAIAAYKAGEPERDAKKKNEDTRLARHRAERAALFALINAAGEHLPYNAPMAEVRALAKKVQESATATATDGETATPPATAPATPATATQPPPTITHPPEEEKEKRAQPAQPTPAGRVGMALKQVGVSLVHCNLSDPVFLALLEQGATPEEFAGLAREALDSGIERPWPWVLKVLPGRREKAQRLKLAPKPESKPAWEGAA